MAPLRLRGHHFLCILTYRGLGYTPEFVANMSDIVSQIAEGRPVVLLPGPDDICAGLTVEARKACDHDCARPETMALDVLAIEAVRPFLPDLDAAGFVLKGDDISRLRAAFASGSIRSACLRCRWSDLCDGIAAEGFAGTRLHSP